MTNIQTLIPRSGAATKSPRRPLPLRRLVALRLDFLQNETSALAQLVNPQIICFQPNCNN